MKLAEYASLIGISGVVLAVAMRLNLVTTTLDNEGVNRGDFFIGVLVLLVMMITVAFALSRR